MRARILIVEDEEPLALLLRYNLEAEGYDVETVARGDEADIRLREAPPDLVVLDWMLPGLSGIELCRRLRARAREQGAADHHADRARRGKRARARARDRRRRLHRQAVLGARADRSRARAVARAQAPSASPTCWRIGEIELDREKKRVSRAGRASRSRPDRIPPARIPDGAARPGVLARAAARRGMGLARSISTSAPSTFMSAGCARRSTAAARPTRSAPSVAPATRWTTASAARQRKNTSRFRIHSALPQRCQTLGVQPALDADCAVTSPPKELGEMLFLSEQDVKDALLGGDAYREAVDVIERVLVQQSAAPRTTSSAPR